MGLIKVAEISIEKLEDRKTVTAILHENGYTVGPGKRKKTAVMVSRGRLGRVCYPDKSKPKDKSA